jgi:putative protease
MNSELLLPVGNMEMCLAAVHHGADAIYVGVPFFNARGRTTDLTMEELKEMVELCHLYGVKVNLAFNVVIFQNEIPKVISLLEQILPLNPDAFIVQDLGLAKIIRTMAPHQRIHASTQMTVTNADAIRLVDDLKIDRFVLGRENSLPEIKLIREQTDKELEVFVHGALCVAYSGQCFTSESLGGRSANRGQCAQSCRLEYELYVDDEKKEMGDKKYLVSPKDLMGLSEVPLLKELGINSFKVEGRLKTPEYVASTAKNYREVLDGGAINFEKRREELATTYSRGFFSGWLNGVDHQQLVDGTYSSHRGIEVGRVLEVRKRTILVSSEAHLKAGMGLVFVGTTEEGAKIFLSNKIGKNFELELLKKDAKIQKGMKVYLNSNEALFGDLQKVWQTREKQKRIPLNFLVQGLYNEPLLVKAIDPEGREVYAQSISFLAPAKGRSVTEDFIKDEVGSLGSTVYKIGKWECFLQEGLFLNHRELKEIRKELVQKMNDLRINRSVKAIHLINFQKNNFEIKSKPELNILLRSKSQVEGFIDGLSALDGYKKLIRTIILDFEFGKDYAASVELVRSHGLKVGVATTRILKPSEYYNLNTLIRLNPDVILVRNLGAIHYLKSKCEIPLIGDFSLNVTNSLSLGYLIDKGIDSINVSYDLNQHQLFDMIEHSSPSDMEVTVHQYMPEFHMEHCVFAAFLSKGSSFKDCGKPCEKHEVKLKDPYGNMHFLKADHECRNTFFKGTPQSAGFLIHDLIKKGVGCFRIEALNEEPQELNTKILNYLKLINGEVTSDEMMKNLKVMESYGLGLGQLNRSDSYRDRKKE